MKTKPTPDGVDVEALLYDYSLGTLVDIIETYRSETGDKRPARDIEQEITWRQSSQ